MGTRLYLEAVSGSMLHEAKQELEMAGFYVEVMRDFDKLHLELVRMSKSDILIFWFAGMSTAAAIKIGYAVAAGMRIIGIGQCPYPELQSFFAMTVDAFDDLKRNHFVKLGSGDWRKS